MNFEDVLKVKINKCTKCSLYKNRTNTVIGYGNPKAKIMFIGEAPGNMEDRTGMPFVGQSGKLLDKLLNHIHLKREDVYIANILKCRPPNNRNPLDEEIKECKKYLYYQIKNINPKFICCLGTFAAQTILHTDKPMKVLHGNLYKNKNRYIFVSYHPAYGLYGNSNIKVMKRDFERLYNFVKEN